MASAAEEQSAATAEAQQAVEQQTTALEGSQQAAQALAALAEDLQSDRTGASRAEEVASAAEELSATVQEMSGSAGQIMTALGQIARGAQAQAAATQKSSAAMAQIERAAVSTRGAAAGAVQKLEALAPRVGEGRTAAEGLGRSLEEALREAEAVAALVASLEAARRRIEKIVDAIALVAVQTNMLAVSGSVEAARAGESGRGFAVVSSDIRDLARDAAGNADRMKDVVRDIHDHVEVVRRDLDSMSAASLGEVARIASLAGQLVTAETELATLRAGADEIVASAATVLDAVREISAGTQAIAAAAEEASGAATQASAAAREQAKSVEELAAAIEEIANLADELRTGGDPVTPVAWTAAEGRSLTVTVAGEVLALPAGMVREVLRPRPVTRVPHAPAALLGLANMRGAALPVVSLAALMGRETAAPSGATRVVVMEGEVPVGLLVDSVSALGGGSVRTVDPDALLARAFGTSARRGTGARGRASAIVGPGAVAPQAILEELALIAFLLAGQEYALPLDKVAAVMRLPAEVAAVPRTGQAMLGVTAYRGGLLPLVSPHALLGISVAEAARARARIVVARLGPALVGLVVDCMTAILRLPEAAIDPVPPVLTRGAGEARVEAIGRLEGRTAARLHPRPGAALQRRDGVAAPGRRR
ncbi:chemotaxis protein CheW [Siccirubricoccus sp. G192]|uniref:chemotaxis protein CheW n=1 Tax=Siccirubricoccus sp. G192 TaxID=2849651 RepID=UPI0038D232A7